LTRRDSPNGDLVGPTDASGTGPQLIDTSLWIEALRQGGPASARRAVADALESGTAVVNGLVRSELLRGARSEQDLARPSGLLEGVVCVPLTPSTFEKAARLGFDLRLSGAQLPTVDLVIAASAMVQDAELLHCDRHFEIIAAHSPLRQRLV
jgi:predicted nucleic acid-binding protein